MNLFAAAGFYSHPPFFVVRDYRRPTTRYTITPRRRLHSQTEDHVRVRVVSLQPRTIESQQRDFTLRVCVRSCKLILSGKLSVLPQWTPSV